jgi:hypothetical protein
MFLTVSVEKKDAKGTFNTTIEECLEQYWDDPTEKGKNEIWIAPKVLIIYVNRYAYDYTLHKKNVLTSKVLEITQHSDKSKKQYNLCG